MNISRQWKWPHNSRLHDCKVACSWKGQEKENVNNKRKRGKKEIKFLSSSEENTWWGPGFLWSCIKDHLGDSDDFTCSLILGLPVCFVSKGAASIRALWEFGSQFPREPTLQCTDGIYIYKMYVYIYMFTYIYIYIYIYIIV